MKFFLQLSPKGAFCKYLPKGLSASILCFLTIFTSCNFFSDDIQIKLAKGYPRWLKSDSSYTQQTSGIAFIRRDENNAAHFILADDVGKLHHLSIRQDTIFTLKRIKFSDTAESFLRSLPRQDFEELSYDRTKNEVFLSIEGHSPSLWEAGIYKLSFYQNDPLSDSVLSIEKLNIRPADQISRYLANNIGFEGFTTDEDNFYLGLEGFSTEGVFADSTLLYIVARKDLSIKKVINTKSLGIHTICGLYSDKKNSLLGVDRNNKKIFSILLNDNGEIIKFKSADLKSIIPGYPEFQYTASFEGITMDDEENIYLVDDPWEKFFIPSTEILQRLSDETKRNFRNFIPVIYKYKYR